MYIPATNPLESVYNWKSIVGIVGGSVVDSYCFHLLFYSLLIVFFSNCSILYINLQCHQDVAESIHVTVGSLWQDNLLGKGRCLIWSTFNFFWEFWATRWSLLDTNTTGVVMVSFQAPAFSTQVCWVSGQLRTERLPCLSHHHWV